MSDDRRDIALVRVKHNEDESLLVAPTGTPLRDVLLANGLSPYTQLTDQLNCGGHGLCGTCGVRFIENEPDPDHWHDRLADQFGYPRLSCQIPVDSDMTVRLPDKIVWGSRSSGKD